MDEATVETTDAAEALWTAAAWGGQMQYRCGACPWDTLEGEEAMRAHVRAAHGQQQATAEKRRGGRRNN